MCTVSKARYIDMKMTKRILCALIAAVLMMAPAISLADTSDVMYYTISDGSLPSNYSSTTRDLIVVKNPTALISSTTTKSYVISAIAKPGAVVTLYSYNSFTGRYDKMVSESGYIMETTVGASGLYAQSVNLNLGKNNIMVVAKNASGVEAVKMEITLNLGFVDKIKNFGLSVSQIFG